MPYYIYDSNSEIVSQSDTQPTSGIWCSSNVTFDLDLNRVIVGAVAEDHTLTYYTVKAKPAEQLAAALKDVRAANTALGQQVTALTLSGAQKDTQITQLGQQVVQLQLDIAALKGGTAS